MALCSVRLFVAPHYFSTQILTVLVMGGAGVHELTVEIQFRGAAVWYPAAGFLIVHCQITFRTTPCSLLHFLVDHCRKHLYPSQQCFAYSAV